MNWRPRLHGIRRVSGGGAVPRGLAVCWLALAFSGLAAAAELRDGLARCAGLQDSEQRLQCYDELAAVNSRDYVTPDASFLAAQLRVDASRQDYRLTMRDFISMVNEARVDEKKPVLVYGWTRRDDRYALHLKLHEPLTVEFIHVRDGDGNYCVLQPVVTRRGITDPDQFITILAAMTYRQ